MNLAYRLFAVLLELGLTALLAVAVVPIVQSGLSSLYPEIFGVRLSKQPLLGFLANYAWSYKLTVGHAFALVLLICVGWAWVRLLKLWLADGLGDGGSPLPPSPPAETMVLDPGGGNGLAREEEICYSPQTSQGKGRQGGCHGRLGGEGGD